VRYADSSTNVTVVLVEWLLLVCGWGARLLLKLQTLVSKRDAQKLEPKL
jgi:hypothetical protein